ncbi:MAG: radical SAM protein [Deltaproteobacteria bacterium]|nr:radical SAM protein [Deltaproteobacteria bacterium]
MRRRILLVNPPVLAVDRVQVGLYAEALPFGLLQIAAHLRDGGADVELIDMMGYPDRDAAGALRSARRWGRKPAGDNATRLWRDVFLYGRTMRWLQRRLGGTAAPDEVWVTCCIAFNFEPAHEVIRLCRERFPRARIRFGGFYPSQFPEQARTSGADEVYRGYYSPADGVFPAIDLLESRPPIWIFRLALGCRYRCSYCSNALHRSEVIFDPAAVAREILRLRMQFGVSEFSNWDPNVMLQEQVLESFLARMAAAGAPAPLKFEMGIQPDRLTPPILARMKAAGVVAMTIPFESAEPAMMRRFGKPYRMKDAMDAVALARESGFDTSRFHCTWVVGLRDESWRHVFRTYFGVLKAGGRPTPFPLSPAPGTREYARHEPYLRGKDLSELNGHLWPALPSRARVLLYDRVFAIINQPDPRRAARLAADLPRDAREAFEREHEWYLAGPHRRGDAVDAPEGKP